VRASWHGSGPPRPLATWGGVQQAFFAGGGRLDYGFNARTGEKLWRFDMNPQGTRYGQDAELRRGHTGFAGGAPST